MRARELAQNEAAIEIITHRFTIRQPAVAVLAVVLRGRLPVVCHGERCGVASGDAAVATVTPT